jgi:hypothetical protein
MSNGQYFLSEALGLHLAYFGLVKMMVHCPCYFDIAVNFFDFFFLLMWWLTHRIDRWNFIDMLLLLAMAMVAIYQGGN